MILLHDALQLPLSIAGHTRGLQSRRLYQLLFAAIHEKIETINHFNVDTFQRFCSFCVSLSVPLGASLRVTRVSGDIW